MATIPCIACIGIIGKANNPLSINIFPTHQSTTPPTRAPVLSPLQFSLLLSSTLDIFESRSKANLTSGGGLSGDFGLLHAIDERLAAYGFETNTDVKLVIVVDMMGRYVGDASEGPAKGSLGLRDGEMKLVFRAIQAAYVRLLQNPFYEPDEHSPASGKGGKMITSRRFENELRKIGETWTPGMTSL